MLDPVGPRLAASKALDRSAFYSQPLEAFSVGGEVYSSTDQFKVDYVVSVDIVSLERLLSLQSCDQNRKLAGLSIRCQGHIDNVASVLGLGRGSECSQGKHGDQKNDQTTAVARDRRGSSP